VPKVEILDFVFHRTFVANTSNALGNFKTFSVKSHHFDVEALKRFSSAADHNNIDFISF
jgi:hypothetical protein